MNKIYHRFAMMLVNRPGRLDVIPQLGLPNTNLPNSQNSKWTLVQVNGTEETYIDIIHQTLAPSVVYSIWLGTNIDIPCLLEYIQTEKFQNVVKIATGEDWSFKIYNLRYVLALVMTNQTKEI